MGGRRMLYFEQCRSHVEDNPERWSYTCRRLGGIVLAAVEPEGFILRQERRTSVRGNACHSKNSISTIESDARHSLQNLERKRSERYHHQTWAISWTFAFTKPPHSQHTPTSTLVSRCCFLAALLSWPRPLRLRMLSLCDTVRTRTQALALTLVRHSHNRQLQVPDYANPSNLFRRLRIQHTRILQHQMPE